MTSKLTIAASFSAVIAMLVVLPGSAGTSAAPRAVARAGTLLGSELHATDRQRVQGPVLGTPSRAVKSAGRHAPRSPVAKPSGTVTQSFSPTPSTLATGRKSTTSTTPKIALYNGLNSPGLSAANSTPPDSTGAIGPNHYVEMANSSIEVWHRNLTSVTSSTLANWVGIVGGLPDAGYCDPQIQWDASSNRWLYAFILCNPDSTYQEIDFGWSKTSDPSNLAAGWCEYYINSTPDMFDYPKLGHNSKYLILGGNLFDTSQSLSNPPFIGSLLLWVAKPTNGVTTCPSTTYHTSPSTLVNGDGVSETFTPVPVNTMTSSGNGYVVSAYDATGGGAQSKLAFWHLDSAGVLHQDLDVNVASFSLPSPAPQPGTANVLDTSDTRLTQAVGDPTSGIWTQHTVNGTGGRSKVHWYQVKISGGVPTLTQQGDIASSTDFVFNGAISPRADAGGAAIVYNRSGTAQLPLIAAQIRVTATTAGTMEPGELVLGTSAAFDADFSCNNPSPGTPCRWGDYAGASPDPVVKNVVWGTSEVITASTSNPAWLNRNFALSFVTAPHAPTSVTAVAHDRSARITWTPSAFVPSSPVTSYTIASYIGAAKDTVIVVSGSVTSALFPYLTDGVTYTFTVIATNTVGDSPESSPSNAVTPTRAQTQSTAASSARITATQSSPNAPPTPRP